jgi:hypothetical protein
MVLCPRFTLDPVMLRTIVSVVFLNPAHCSADEARLPSLQWWDQQNYR